MVSPEVVGLVVLVLLAGLIYWYLKPRAPQAKSGREDFHANDGWRGPKSNGADGEIPMDTVAKRHPDAPDMPVLRTDVSTIALGQTGLGKSTFIKQQVLQQNLDRSGIVCHALSGSGSMNEFAEFFGKRGLPVMTISSRNSTHRWDPFIDYPEDLRAMESIADGLFTAEQTATTGWSDPARTLLLGATVLTSAKHGDFAKLPEVLERGPEPIVEEVGQIPQARLVVQPLREMSEDDRATAYSALLNTIRPILMSDLFDDDLEPISLEDYFAHPTGVVILDNIRKDRFALGFWRFFIESAIDISMESAGQQFFILDEFDKLPPIGNLVELVSAGRSPQSLGILALQDVHQLTDRYDGLARSIWVNCPNRVAFNSGDDQTADLPLSSIGRVEVERQNVSMAAEVSVRDEDDSTTVSRSKETVRPITSGELLDLGVGEALVQSPNGWWLGKLTEPDLEQNRQTTKVAELEEPDNNDRPD